MTHDPQPRADSAGSDDSIGGADDDKSWLRRPLTDSIDIASHYDGWAATYETDLVGMWRYEAPFEAARRLAAMGASSPVLDIGCGIGITGRALAAEGFDEIDGIDLSEVSLAAALATAHYRHLRRHDFNEAPLPFPDDSYGAVECVGVLSYAWDPRNLVLEMCRVVRPGGAFVFTHRTDLWKEQNFEEVLNGLRDAGHLSDVDWSEPMPYMPGNEDFTDQIQVHYVSCRVR